LINT